MNATPRKPRTIEETIHWLIREQGCDPPADRAADLSLSDLGLQTDQIESVRKRLETRYGIPLNNGVIHQPLREIAAAIHTGLAELNERFLDPKRIFDNLVFSGQTRRLRSPYELNIDMTFRCNARCIFCYDSSGEQPSANDELTTEEVCRIIDEFADNAGAFILFGGGEPFLRRDFLDVFRHAKSRGLWTYIISNGSLITEKIAKEYAVLFDKRVDRIQISLDGSTAEVHDFQRGVPGIFYKTVAGIENLNRVGIQPIINCVVTKHNVSDIPNIIEFCLQHDVRTFRALKLHPLGRGKNPEVYDKLAMSLEEEFELYRYLEGKREELRGHLGIAADNACVFPMAVPEIRSRFQPRPGVEPASYACSAGTVKLAVSPTGDVVPCSYFYDFPELKIGNLRERSLMDIWNDEELWRPYREPLTPKGKCTRCPYLYACKTGCRIMSYVADRDMGFPDPGCAYNPDEDKTSEAERRRMRTHMARVRCAG